VRLSVKPRLYAALDSPLEDRVSSESGEFLAGEHEARADPERSTASRRQWDSRNGDHDLDDKPEAGSRGPLARAGPRRVRTRRGRPMSPWLII